MASPILEQMDGDVSKLSLGTMPEEIQLLDDLVLHLNHGATLLTGTKNDRGLNMLASLLIGRAFNSLWRAREDAVRGYPTQSLSLCRTALEDWATLKWVESHPDSIDMWLWAIVDEVERPERRPPTFQAIWDEMGDDGAFPSEIYDVLSKFAHPKSLGLRWIMSFDPDSTHFHYGPHFDEQNLKICLFFLVQIAQVLLDRVAALQHRTLGEPDSDWVRQGLELSERARVFMRTALSDASRIHARGDGSSDPTAGA